MMHLIKCYIITAYVRDKSWSVIFCKREMNIVVPDVDGFETLFGSRGFCFWDYRVGLYSLCFKVEVTLLLMLSLVDSDRYLQLASLPNSNLTPDEQKALKWLKTDENIVILPADKGTGDCCYGQDRLQRQNGLACFNDKQTYEVLNRDPTPALQRKLNNKLLTRTKTDEIDFRLYNRLRCSVPQPPKLYGLPKLHKPNIPMRPIVSFCGSPTYQLSKYLTNVLKPLSDESRHKLQSTENFIVAIKIIQIPDDRKLVSFDVKSLFTNIPLQLALDCTENAIKNSTVELPLPTDDIMDLINLCLTSPYFQYNGKYYKQ